jgi:hypothetical protein
MVRTPWQWWDLDNRVPAEGMDTTEAIAIVGTAFQHIEASGGTPHPGLLRFYVHIMEMSPGPKKALDASYRLQTLVPDAGHLIHMPSHVYVLCGQYQRTIDSNVEALVADDKYIAVDGRLGSTPFTDCITSTSKSSARSFPGNTNLSYALPMK